MTILVLYLDKKILKSEEKKKLQRKIFLFARKIFLVPERSTYFVKRIRKIKVLMLNKSFGVIYFHFNIFSKKTAK